MPSPREATMKFIVDADPSDAPEVLAKMIAELPAFQAGPWRVGWGWHYTIAGQEYFIRRTKAGLSASKARDNG